LEKDFGPLAVRLSLLSRVGLANTTLVTFSHGFWPKCIAEFSLFEVFSQQSCRLRQEKSSEATRQPAKPL